MKIKSIQELEWGGMCVGSNVGWSQSCNDVGVSNYEPFPVVLSSFHQEKDLALKSPKIIGNKELDEAVLLKSSSKSDRKFPNSALSWPRDL